MQGVFLPRNTILLHWESLCQQWVACMDSYCAAVDCQDALHYYLERTNAGILALAAARCGHQVLPEMWVTRTKKGGLLDVCILNTQLDRMELVECKWLQAPRQSIISASRRRLEAACAEAANVVGNPVPLSSRFKNVGRVGVVFVVPGFDAGTAEAVITSVVQNTLDTMQAQPYFDAMAWYFPKQLRTSVLHYKAILPGVVLLVKACQTEASP